MHTQYLIVNYCCHGKTIKAISERFPDHVQGEGGYEGQFAEGDQVVIEGDEGVEEEVGRLESAEI